MHHFDKIGRVGVLAGLLLVVCPVDAFSQNSKQIPQPRPPTAPAATPAEPWFHDSRWWAIGATGFLSILGLVLQWRFRISDKKSEAASEQFDGDIKDPIKESYKELRSLANTAAIACEIVDAEERAEAVKKLQSGCVCTALNLFAMVLREADKRLALKGELSDVNADLEDSLFTSLPSIARCDNPDERSALSRQISSAVSTAIVECDKKLRVQRKIFIANWNDGAA